MESKFKTKTINMDQPNIAPQGSPQLSQPQPAPHNWKQGLLIAVAVLASFAILNLVIWGLYMGRAYPGVKIGGQDVSNLDAAAVASRVSEVTSNYRLKLQVKGEVHQLKPEAVDLVHNSTASAQQAINKGKQSWLPLYGLLYTWQNGSLDLKYNVNDTKLAKLAQDFAGTASVAPIDAKVVIEGEVVRVEADKPGKGVDPVRLAQLLRDDIGAGLRSDSIGERSTEALTSTKEAEAVVPAIEKAMKLPLSIQVNGKLFAPSVSEIGTWLTTSADTTGRLSLATNQSAIAAYVATVASQVDVAPVTKQINMVNGVVRTVSQGKDGSALDQSAVATALSVAITTSKATAVAGSMKTVAFKTRTNNTVDLNGKYVEINLARQHMWVYDDKQLVYDAPITSGATGAGFATVQGLFSIKAKQTNRNLNGYAIGYNYNVFVQYWMPFYGNYGLHDASWRSSFGGSDYYYGGSHGCVNLPTDAAAWLYNFVVVGTPVWVHS